MLGETRIPRRSVLRGAVRGGRGIADLACGVNFLLDLPPDKRGRIPRDYIDGLMRLRNNAALS